MTAIKDLVDLVDKLNKFKADREIMPLIIKINKVAEQVKMENMQLKSEIKMLKVKNSEVNQKHMEFESERDELKKQAAENERQRIIRQQNLPREAETRPVEME